MDQASVSTDCNTSGCQSSAAIVLAGEDLCLDHFFLRCYEQLDKLEPRIRHGILEAAETSAARAFLEECSNRILCVSLRNESLSNLERSRLLDILLTCGDLQPLLCRPTPRKTPTYSFGLASRSAATKS
jgi:hypothetical protein